MHQLRSRGEFMGGLPARPSTRRPRLFYLIDGLMRLAEGSSPRERGIALALETRVLRRPDGAIEGTK
jgi:hypothetical protein